MVILIIYNRCIWFISIQKFIWAVSRISLSHLLFFFLFFPSFVVVVNIEAITLVEHIVEAWVIM